MSDRKFVLVTGSSGFIGSRLVSLLAKTYNVIYVDKLMYGQQDGTVKTSLKEYLDRSNLTDLYAVVHLSGLSNDPVADFDAEANMKYNYEDTKVLVDKCIDFKVPRFIYASSASVYGFNEDRILNEDGGIDPKSNYSKSKWESEKYITEKHMAGSISPIILRKATVMGVSPRMRFDLCVNTMIKDAITKGKIILYGGGENWRPLVNIEDVCNVYKRFLDMSDEEYTCCSHHRIFNVVHKNYRISELGLWVAYLLKKWHKVECKVESDYDMPKDVRSYRLSGDSLELSAKYRCDIGLTHTVDTVMNWINKNDPNFEDPRYYNIRYLNECRKWSLRLGHGFVL